MIKVKNSAVCIYIHSKKMLDILNLILGKNLDKPSHSVKNVIEKCNPMAGFVRILPKIGLKQPSIFLKCIYMHISSFTRGSLFDSSILTTLHKRVRHCRLSRASIKLINDSITLLPGCRCMCVCVCVFL